MMEPYLYNEKETRQRAAAMYELAQLFAEDGDALLAHYKLKRGDLTVAELTDETLTGIKAMQMFLAATWLIDNALDFVRDNDVLDGKDYGWNNLDELVADLMYPLETVSGYTHDWVQDNG